MPREGEDDDDDDGVSRNRSEWVNRERGLAKAFAAGESVRLDINNGRIIGNVDAPRSVWL